MALGKELEFFAARKREWLATHQGEFAVVAGSTVAGFYASFEEAFRAGVRAFGVTSPFLVKQVCKEEPTYFIF